MECYPDFRNKQSVREIKDSQENTSVQFGVSCGSNISIRNIYWSPYIVLDVLGTSIKHKTLAPVRKQVIQLGDKTDVLLIEDGK